MQATGSLFNTTTLAETALPDGPLYQNDARLSPDGRWMTVSTLDSQSVYSSHGTALIDTQTGTIEPLDAPFHLNATWRPNHTEMWTSLPPAYPSDRVADATTFIKTPGQPTVQITGLAFESFSDDGAYFFSEGGPFDQFARSELVGSADDPTGSLLPALPNGTSLNYSRTLGDGRLLTQSDPGLDSFDSYFVQLVDPREGTMQLLGQRGYLAAVGKTRALALYDVSYLRGDLKSTDLATGETTVLAPEFAAAVAAEPQSDDPVPVGGRVVYQYQAHFASSWDGLWVATVP
jgi:hypothetical protein